MPTLKAEELRSSDIPLAKLELVKSLHGKGLVTAHFFPCQVPRSATRWWNRFTGRDIMIEAQNAAFRKGTPRWIQQTELYVAEGRTTHEPIPDGMRLSCPTDVIRGMDRGRVALMVSDFLRVNPACTGMRILTSVFEGIAGSERRYLRVFTRQELGERLVFVDGPPLELTASGTIRVSVMPQPSNQCDPPTILFEFPFSNDRSGPWTDAPGGPFSRFSLMWVESELSRERALDERDDRTESSRERGVPAYERQHHSEEEEREYAGAEAGPRHDESKSMRESTGLDIRKTMFPTWFASSEDSAQGSGSGRNPPALTEDDVKMALRGLNLMRERRDERKDSGAHAMAWLGVVVGSGAEISGTGVV